MLWQLYRHFGSLALPSGFTSTTGDGAKVLGTSIWYAFRADTVSFIAFPSF
jgi:hypothetical protein